jgi:hypothetical protein
VVIRFCDDLDKDENVRDTSYFPAQNFTPLAFGENRPAGGKLQGRTELNLTSVVAADSFL